MFTRNQLPALFALAGLAMPAAAEQILFESATLGPTGITPQQLLDQEVPGTNVFSGVFVGARFELTQPVVTSRIGGHFASLNDGDSFFGALVALDGQDDLPDSDDLSTPDVLGHTLLTFPQVSGDVDGALELALSPGWYGVVFGSGLFGADGAGALVQNNIDIPGVGYLANGNAWDVWPLAAATGSRFTVVGETIPEPMSLVYLASCFAFQIRRQPCGKMA